VGALLLNGKWEAGARLILAGQQNDRPDIAVARAAFLERGALGSKQKAACFMSSWPSGLPTSRKRHLYRPLQRSWRRTDDSCLKVLTTRGNQGATAIQMPFATPAGDVAAALNGLPRFLTAECAILGGLQAHPGNWLTALECIPRSMRMMYVHAYQVS